MTWLMRRMHFLTAASSSAATTQCISSSSSSPPLPLPSLTEPLPRMEILAPLCRSMVLSVFREDRRAGAEEVDLGELFDGQVDFLGGTLVALDGEVVGGRAEVGIEFELAVDEGNAFIFELLAVADFARVGTATLIVVRWGAGW